jgi:transmembrane sensor
MDDLARKMEAARQFVEPGWDAARVESSLVRLHGRVRRRRSALVAAAVLAPALAAAVLGWWWTARPDAPPSLEQQASGAGAAIHFADGSTATALSADSHLVAAEVSPTRVRVRLDGGAARFEVTPRSNRLFEVDAGPVAVRVLGTIFSVDRSGQDVSVSVERGRVRVDSGDGSVVVAAGERRPFVSSAAAVAGAGSAAPPDGGDMADALATAEPEPPVPAREPPRAGRGKQPRAAPPTASWQALAQEGRHDEAWAALERAGGPDTAVAPMTDALLASDVARLSGHPDAAVHVLERAIDHAPGDPLASVAHYTLGRVLLTQVGRPRDAAEAFGRARRLAPGGALAEDALAREVEAWSRAGDAGQARRRASEYVELYPSGRRAGAVRRLGGLDPAPPSP